MSEPADGPEALRPTASPGVHFVDAGPALSISFSERTLSDLTIRRQLQAFEEAMRDIGSATDLDRVLERLVTTVAWFTGAQAAAMDVVGLAPSRAERVVVHLGMTADEALTTLGCAEVEAWPAPAGHRHEEAVEHDGDTLGRIVLWRRHEAFAELERMTASALTTLVGVGIDKMLRRGVEHQRQRWLQAVAEITDLLVANRPTAEVMQVLAEHACAVSGCDLAWVATGSTAEDLELLGAAGHEFAVGEIRGVDLSRTLTAEVVRTGRTGEVADSGPWGTSDGRLVTALGLVVPVVVSSRVEGALGLAWGPRRGYEYRALDPDLPVRFAEQAALTVRLARSRQDAERLTLLEERDRIGLDLHDRAIQRLYALGMSLDTARREGATKSPDAVLRRAVDEVDGAIRGIRRTIAGLGASEEGMELYDALARLVDCAGTGLETELRVSGLGTTVVPAAVAADLLAVCSEALSNVARHAEASRCRVTLEVEDALVLTVDDDGRGSEPGAAGSGHANMRRRAAVHGGTLRISGRAPGTRVVWSVPLFSEESREE